MCVGVQLKGLQDAVGLAVGALGEHEGVGALCTRSPSQQPQRPGQSPVAQGGHFDAAASAHHEDGGKQRDAGDHQPHFRSCGAGGKAREKLGVKRGEREHARLTTRVPFHSTDLRYFSVPVLNKSQLGLVLCWRADVLTFTLDSPSF